jgi:hypothetical protein
MGGIFYIGSIRIRIFNENLCASTFFLAFQLLPILNTLQC